MTGVRENLWDYMVPYIPKHSPVGALLLVFSCLKKVADPKGFWLQTSQIFGASNFFSDRRELIEQSEKWSIDGLSSPGWSISDPMSSEEVNRWLIQDLLVDYIDTNPLPGYIEDPESSGGSGEDIQVFLDPQSPKIVKVWPFYADGWRIIYRTPFKKWSPTNLDNIISLMQSIGFQTWLGFPATSLTVDQWGGGGKIIPVSAPIKAKQEEASIDAQTISRNAEEQKRLAGPEIVSYVNPFRQIGISGPVRRVFRLTVKYYPRFGQLTASLILSRRASSDAVDSADKTNFKSWIEYYRSRYDEQKHFLFQYIHVKPYIPEYISSVYPVRRSEKKRVNFSPSAKDNQNNPRPRSRLRW